ncbi:phosphoglycolate phosphatase [Psychromarinibacter sp. C21-152]|uniref:phosphoglycolate phosphatase n=1 Tax=Psychromarinibacter sediminicola TaxID=3033385 RepID=A0AAE3NVU5_9RHOB|nr:phosphoglycolate phosphatase [Psychromarinibacter sediminicola]MDF0601577.1 phosphoglycolate phosphatase [Psychromarinibacter sediminicola]
MSGVVFDLDGTLIDATLDIHACATEMLEAEGLAPLSPETIQGFVGNGLGKLITHCIEASGLEDSPARHKRMYDRFHARYETAVEHTVVFPGAVDALEALKAEGYRLGLCTNKPEGPTHGVLRHLGLERYFDAFAYGDGPYPRKPDPAPVRHIIDQLPVRRVLYVGDSEVDAATAQAAKVPMALYTRGFRKTPVEELYHDAHFDDWSELPAIAARLAPRPE